MVLLLCILPLKSKKVGIQGSENTNSERKSSLKLCKKIYGKILLVIMMADNFFVGTDELLWLNLSGADWTAPRLLQWSFPTFSIPLLQPFVIIINQFVLRLREWVWLHFLCWLQNSEPSVRLIDFEDFNHRFVFRLPFLVIVARRIEEIGAKTKQRICPIFI